MASWRDDPDVEAFAVESTGGIVIVAMEAAVAARDRELRQAIEARTALRHSHARACREAQEFNQAKFHEHECNVLAFVLSLLGDAAQ